MFGHPSVSDGATAVLLSRPPANPAERAERALRNSPYLALRNVTCDYQGGVLILRGCLPSYYLKQLAQEAVTDLDEVDRIENQIQVVTPAFRLRRG